MNTYIVSLLVSSSLFVITTFLFPAPAHAYLDPGTGSYMFQLLLGTGFGIWLTFSHRFLEYVKKTRSLLGIRK